MSSSHIDQAAHGTILSDSLRRLQLREQVPSSLVEPTHKHQPGSAEQHGAAAETVVLNSGPPSPDTQLRQAHGHVYEGYGFRPSSGVATPLNNPPPPAGSNSPLPDPNGLGWPGGLCLDSEPPHRR